MLEKIILIVLPCRAKGSTCVTREPEQKGFCGQMGTGEAARPPGGKEDPKPRPQ